MKTGDRRRRSVLSGRFLSEVVPTWPARTLRRLTTTALAVCLPCHRYAIISRPGRVRSQHQNEQGEASVRRSARPLGTLLGSCSVLPL